jgi:uncharacterized membrane protein
VLIIAAAILLAFGLIELQWKYQLALIANWPRLFAAEPRGSEAMLSAIAASMITVAGVVFSITIVALAQASTQYSPRVLRNFMRDKRNQVVLGFFVGVFAYCLVLLRNISWDQEQHRIPSLAIFVAFLLALAAIGFLIFFIHHIASSIQASTMTHSITAETLKVIDRMFPEGQSRPEASEEVRPTRLPHPQWHAIPAEDFGYIQSIETERLFKLACKRQIVIRLEQPVGGFALKGRPLAWVCGCGPADTELVRQVNRNFAIDAHRTVDQDPAFGVQQLSDIAVKALSPGINDTTTAITAIDYLSELFCSMAGRKLEPRRWFDGELVRIITCPFNFPGVLDSALEPILENAEGNRSVMHHILDALKRVGEAASLAEYREALRHQASCVAQIIPTITISSSRRAVQAQLNEVLSSLGGT